MLTYSVGPPQGTGSACFNLTGYNVIYAPNSYTYYYY